MAIIHSLQHTSAKQTLGALLLALALIAGAVAPAFSANGVRREVYSGIGGVSVDDLTNSPAFPDLPTSTEVLTEFEAPTDVGDNYGQRLSALLIPPTTGNYIFWIAGDDNSRLYLSSNDLPAGLQLIAEVPGWTNSREWGKYAEQQSAPVFLEAGKRYYIEALMKEGGGGDNLAVRWQLPSGTREEPIPNQRLELIPVTPPDGVLREVFTNIAGNAVADLLADPNYPSRPATTQILPNFEAPVDVLDNYGQRLRAWLVPPVTGQYRFWIASDDNSMLLLSTTDQPAQAQVIASVPEWTNFREWNKFAQQQSALISLVAGQRYYIEALMKEGTGGDNLSVRWQLPGGAIEEPIRDKDLESFRLAVPDSWTMRHGGKARFKLTRNDQGYVSSGVEVVTPPGAGTAVASGEWVTYQHTIGTPLSDSFTYRLRGLNGGPPSAPATVSVNFSTAARFGSDFTQFPPETPQSNWQLVDHVPGVTFNQPNHFCPVPGNPDQLLVVEAYGNIWLIPDTRAASPQKVLFMNIGDRVSSDGNERGLKSIACHPNFASNGQFYVTYNTANPNHVRLSRFTRMAGNPLQGNPASEQILISHLDEGPYHNIDTLRFGPDGYLYVSFGDEGVQEEEFQNAQYITKDFFSAIIRIDVDKQSGNLEPNLHYGVPRDGQGKAYYSVPADNPFVGATTFNGQAVNPLQVRTEFYVHGFRNPWQFSFDPGTNRLWVADVGRGDREEITLMGPGENAGWSWREGTIAGPRNGQLINGASQYNVPLVEPLFDYGHNVGQSITGGFVYEGASYPSLAGLYIFADYVNGSIWTINPASPANTFTRLTGGQYITSFVMDPGTSDILVLERTGYIRRLTAGVDDSSFPQTLSETGFFSDLANLSPNPGAHFYEPNVRFWSDYAQKSNWFLIGNQQDTVSYARDANWTFPSGMIWAKHFDLELVRGNPVSRKRIETRFIVKTAGSSYGVSYRWNDAGTEATLAPVDGVNIPLTINEQGTERTQIYRIPARSECLSCHSTVAGSGLSFSTRQLNRQGSLEGASGNWLNLLSNAGYLTGLNESPAVLPFHVRHDDAQYSLEARARSYLTVNCAVCHRPGGPGSESWDGRAHLNLWQTRLVNGIPVDNSPNPQDRLILPGSPERSVVLSRMRAVNGYTRMPPIASNELDLASIDLIQRWITETLPARQSYDDWRLAHFGNLTSPEGARTANPDNDPDANEAEFLKHTDPLAGADFLRPAMHIEGADLVIEVPNLLGRRVRVATSRDLGLTDPWTLWEVPGNNGISLAPDRTQEFILPLGETSRFFRFLIEEE